MELVISEHRLDRTSDHTVSIKSSFSRLVVLGILFLLAYALATAAVIKNKYQIEQLQDHIGSLEKANSELRIELTKASSLEYVLEASKNLSYSEIKGIHYIEKPSQSPFAVK